MDRTIARCLGRFSKWVQLAREVLRAEFAQFETAQAFGALRLKTRHEQRELASIEAERSNHIEQVSKVAEMLELGVNDLWKWQIYFAPTGGKGKGYRYGLSAPLPLPLPLCGCHHVLSGPSASLPLCFSASLSLWLFFKRRFFLYWFLF